MTEDFGKLSLDEQTRIASEIGAMLKKHNINTKVQIYREEVCQLTQSDVQGRTLLKVDKQLPSTDAEKAEAFNLDVKGFKEKYSGIQIQVNSQLGVGDKYKTITNITTIEDAGTTVDLEHKPGQVMFIDFWATWCPPCQRPMQHNQDMLKDHGEKWGDNLQIVGLSIDKDAATVKSHVENKGWTSVKHYHRAKSDCSDVYQVRGVPHVMILDKQGTIVFKGHPANRKDLVKDFDDLIADKELEGVEKPGADAGGKEEEDAGERSSIDQIKSVMGQMDNFKDIGKQLQTDCKDTATGMMRNFCVLTLEASLNPSTDSWTSEYTNHRVLVGPKDKVDACKLKIEESMGTEADKKEWTFKLNEQVHAQ